MVYLPDQMMVVYERLKRDLQLSPKEIYRYPALQEEKAGVKDCYNLKFWQEILEITPSFKLKKAYYNAYLDALALDRWKIKLEKYPAWVRRHQQVRCINNHMEAIMPFAQKSLHRREAVGLALARMETFDRRVAKKSRLCWAIAGESVYLGDKLWREQLEDLLPKGATYRFCYSYSNLMVKSFYAKMINQILTLQPSSFINKNGLWYPKSLTGFDGLIWIGKREDCPYNTTNIIYCSKELTSLDRHNILKMHNQLKEKLA